MNPSNDPALHSWLPVPPESHFPIQNLPYGIFRRLAGGSATLGVAIGEHVVDLAVLEDAGLLHVPLLRGKKAFATDKLNAFLAAGQTVWSDTRMQVSRLLRADEGALRDNSRIREQALVGQRDVQLLLPVEIGDYTDFYSSREHATNVGTMLRGPDKALQPNWLHLPVAYHGRSSSIVVSGTPVRRPCGQSKPDTAEAPIFGPTRSLDFELEMGVFVGPGNELGQLIPVSAAGQHLFGLVLLNDWSARDIQAWEYVPLGPFLAKNFCTTISPWVVPLEALEPWRTAGPAQAPTPLPYLQATGPGGYDIHLDVHLQSARMKEPQKICASNFRSLYWSLAQQLAHHTVNGCNLRPGDLLGSGTISGSTPDSYGSMLELAWRGARPLTLTSGEQRSFLQDGDRVTLTGWCQGDGYRVGFGEAAGTILPALGGSERAT
jgi:fumarylacetoacetase